MSKDVIITKENGEKESFDRSKLEHSLRRSGAKEDYVQEVADEVEKKIRPEMRTSKIYGKAFSILRKKQRSAATRYSLQRAILEFGPTGYPFEWFVKEIFKALDYDTRVREVIKGACVRHEVDVVACGQGECIGVEAKFHNDVGIKSDLQTVLYVKARFEDLKIGFETGETNVEGPIRQGMLVTNTKFSTTAIKYSECAGLELLGWNYPSEENLQDMIEKAEVHPITALTTLNKQQKRKMLKDDVVLCKRIKEEPELLRKYGVKKTQVSEVEGEVNELYESKK